MEHNSVLIGGDGGKSLPGTLVSIALTCPVKRVVLLATRRFKIGRDTVKD